MKMRIRRTSPRTVEVEVDGDVRLTVVVSPDEEVRVNSRLLPMPQPAATADEHPPTK